MHIWWLAPESNIQVPRLYALVEEQLIPLEIPDEWSGFFEEPTWFELAVAELCERLAFWIKETSTRTDLEWKIEH
jgi:hypothetical protein